MACREAQLVARAEDMRDPVTKRVEMALIRYNPQITGMKGRKQPDWRPRQSEGEKEVEERGGEEQRERLIAPQTKENPADMTGRVNGVATKGDSWAGDQRERGSSVARHSDWNIRDWAH